MGMVQYDELGDLERYEELLANHASAANTELCDQTIPPLVRVRVREDGP